MKHNLLKILFVETAMSLLLPLAASAQSIAINAENFPDENFRNWLLGQEYGRDGILTEAEIESVTSINVSNRQISSLKGIEYFTALTGLECYNNQLTSLDVSQNPALTGLSCSNNQLTSLDISQNLALTDLTCSNSQLTSLDVSQNPALTWLQCSNNQLTSLDISRNPKLTWFYCESNQLTSLDVSQNPELVYLYCNGNQLTSLDVSQNPELRYFKFYSNQIKGEAMDALISSLPQNTNIKDFYVYDESNPNEGNVCTKSQVAAVRAKGWTPYYTDSKGEMWEEYEGSEEETDSIEAVRTDANGNTAIYTLDGKRLNTTNAADLPKGVYIINGKKHVVK